MWILAAVILFLRVIIRQTTVGRNKQRLFFLSWIELYVSYFELHVGRGQKTFLRQPWKNLKKQMLNLFISAVHLLVSNERQQTYRTSNYISLLGNETPNLPINTLLYSSFSNFMHCTKSHIVLIVGLHRPSLVYILGALLKSDSGHK